MDEAGEDVGAGQAAGGGGPAADGPVEAAPDYLAKALEVLERDHRHATLAFLYRGAELVHSEAPTLSSTRAKDEYLGSGLPARVAEHDADGVLLVSEAAGPMGDLLVVFAEQADGSSVSLATTYSLRRWPRRVLLGQTTRTTPGPIPAFAAVRRLWDGRSEPS